MAIKTTLISAATASHFVQLDGRDVLRRALQPMLVLNGQLHCTIGFDDEWAISDQEIEIDDSGAAQVQVRAYPGSRPELKTMRFFMSRPLAASDIEPVSNVA